VSNGSTAAESFVPLTRKCEYKKKKVQNPRDASNPKFIHKSLSLCAGLREHFFFYLDLLNFLYLVNYPD
jgi:hypothetical protein